MHYSCNDIKRILASPQDESVDQNAFFMHMESCPACGQLVNLKPEAEEALGSLLPYPAPESLSRNVMKAVRTETENGRVSAWAGRIRYALLAAIYFVLAAITLLNYKVIIIGISSSWNSLSQIWEIFRTWSISKESLLSYTDKVALSPLLLAALMGAATLIWIFSILRVREITK